MLRVTGWTWNLMKQIRVHPPVFRFLLHRQYFDQSSHNPCMRLGRQFLPLCHTCHVLRANHCVMDRSSMPLAVNAFWAILNLIENWTSATTRTHRNMPGPSPRRWLLSNSLMCGVGNRTHSTGLPLQSDCDVETPLYITNEFHVNHRPHHLFNQRHVPQMREAT